MRWYILNSRSKLLLSIIILSNRFINKPKLLRGIKSIENRTLQRHMNRFCDKLNNRDPNKFYSRGPCYECKLDGIKTYGGWCTCTLLIYLNKSIIGIWRD